MTTGRTTFRVFLVAIFVGLFSPGANASMDAVLWLPLAGGVYAQDASTARNDAILCIPNSLYNGDAGTGEVKPFVGIDAGTTTFYASNIHVVARSVDGGVDATRPIFLCWKDGLTRANFESVCGSGPLCPTCSAGMHYFAHVGSISNRKLICIRKTDTDAGAMVPAEFAQ